MTDYLDESTGEVLDIPEGVDRLWWTANELIAASDQEKAWKGRKGMLSAILIRDQEEKRAVYGDVSVSVRQSLRDEFAADAFRDYVADAQLDGGALLELVLAAKGFDAGKLNDPALAEMVRRFTTKKPTATFVVCERVRKLAPAVAS